MDLRVQRSKNVVFRWAKEKTALFASLKKILSSLPNKWCAQDT